MPRVRYLKQPLATRSVKPKRLAEPCTSPVVAIVTRVDKNGDPATFALSELTGVLLPFGEYVKTLYPMPRTLVIAFGAETALWQLHDHWKDHPRWTWRVSVTRKGGLLKKRVGYFGFQDRTKKKAGRYHLVIDANSFLRTHDKTPENLLALGVEIREFCNEHGLAIRASASGVASQLLRHPLFHPLSRRQVPAFINDAARPHLPGGHYESYIDTAQRMEAVSYIDQENAHHYAAMTTPLPNANSVRAMGYDRYKERPWARRDGRIYQRAMQTHGLVRALVNVPDLSVTHTKRDGTLRRGEHDFVPRLFRVPGQRIAHLWTNEIPYLESRGLEIEHLVAAWGTDEVDKSLVTYAEWAIEQAEKHPHLKAMLLMPYGLLGQKEAEVTFHYPGGDNELLLANRFLPNTKAVSGRVKTTTTNVLQLGLIQSFVRTLSLDFARQAATEGHDIVSVYVDGVFVKLTKGKQLPIFTPWRIKEEYRQIELSNSQRVPVRARARREYQLVK